MRVRTRAEPQPHVLPWEIARRSARSAVVSSRPPAQSGRGESRGGDSGTNAPHGQEQGDGDREHEPEHRGHRDGLDEHAAKQEADGGAAPGRGHEQPDPDGRSTLGRSIAGQPHRQRSQSRAQALQHPAGDQPRQRAGQRADERADRERPDREEQEATFPVHVPQTTGYRRRGDGCEEEAGQQPCGRRERGPVRLLDRRQDRDDHELLEAEVERADGQHPGDGALTPRGRHDACHGGCDGGGTGSDRPTGSSATLMPSRRAGARALVRSLGRSTAARLARFG